VVFVRGNEGGTAGDSHVLELKCGIRQAHLRGLAPQRGRGANPRLLGRDAQSHDLAQPLYQCGTRKTHIDGLGRRP